MYYYVYLLLIEFNNQFYTGYTSNLTGRILLHNEGKVDSISQAKKLVNILSPLDDYSRENELNGKCIDAITIQKPYY